MSMSKTVPNAQFQTPPDTADIKAFRGFQPERDPSQPYIYAGQRRDLQNTYINPLGSYTTPEMREQGLRAGLEDIGQNEAQASRMQNFDFNRLRMAQLGQLAGLTKPEQVGVHKEDTFLGGLLKGGANIAMQAAANKFI